MANDILSPEAPSPEAPSPKGATQAALSAEAEAAFGKDNKVGLLATVSEGSLPHITLITTLESRDPGHLVWGQFSEGRSKQNVRRHPQVAFLVMTLQRELWRGRARWTGAVSQGDDFDHFNRKPLFRYNAYFGIHTVHGMDLVAVGAKERLGLGGMVVGHGLAAPARLALGDRGDPVIKPWAQRLLNRVDTVKFVSWVDDDGWPTLVPAVPCQASSRRLVLAAVGRRSELLALPTDRPVAVFALNMATESVLLRGGFRGFRAGGLGALDIDWVYNSMPPQQGQIFPPLPLEPVRQF